jgi:hypothetical protein
MSGPRLADEIRAALAEVEGGARNKALLERIAHSDDPTVSAHERLRALEMLRELDPGGAATPRRIYTALTFT